MKTKQLKEVDLCKERAFITDSYGNKHEITRIDKETIYVTYIDMGSQSIWNNTLVEVIPVAKGEFNEKDKND